MHTINRVRSEAGRKHAQFHIEEGQLLAKRACNPPAMNMSTMLILHAVLMAHTQQSDASGCGAMKPHMVYAGCLSWRPNCRIAPLGRTA